MEIGPLKDGYKVETPQSNSENVPRLPMSCLLDTYTSPRDRTRSRMPSSD